MGNEVGRNTSKAVDDVLKEKKTTGVVFHAVSTPV